MQVYVTIAMVQGILDRVEVHLDESNADACEAQWLREHAIDTEEQREAKAGGGTEFHVVGAELLP